MAEVNRNRVFSVDVNVRVWGTECTTRLYVGQTDSLGLLRTPRLLADNLASILRTPWRNCLAEQADWLGLKVSGPLGSGVGSYVREKEPGPGLILDDPVPSNCAALIFLLQQDVDTSIRKRIYLAGFPEGRTTANRIDGAPLAANLGTLAEKFRTPFNVNDPTQGLLTFAFCIGTRLTRLTVTGPRYFTCTGTFISRNVAQYRRRNRRGIATPVAIYDSSGVFAETNPSSLSLDDSYAFGPPSGGGE